MSSIHGPVSEDLYRQLAEEWSGIAVGPAVVDEEHFASVKAEADAIIHAGKWTSGPADLMGVLRRRRDELFHSRVLAWLLTPTGRHGLGHRFLVELFDEVWPGEAMMATETVRLQLEVTRSGPDESGQEREARADIVVRGESINVVIENKLDAGEQPDQCERLYWAWAQDPTETRWVFLTPGGHRPTSASSTQARSVWSLLSYGQVKRALSRSLAATQERSADTGRAVAEQYLATLITFKEH